MPKHEMCTRCTKKLMWIFRLYAKAPLICLLSAYVLERDMVFQKAFGRFIIRAVAMPPHDSERFALNDPILDIWSSERLKLTEIGQFERNSKCKPSTAWIECENIYDMVKSFKFYGHLLGKDLRTCLGYRVANDASSECHSALHIHQATYNYLIAGVFCPTRRLVFF